MYELPTRVIHDGEPPAGDGGVTPPLVPATLFELDSTKGVAFSIHDQADDGQYVYSRWSNPTVRRLERKVASLEEGEDAVAFASGMAAITGLLLHVLDPGDHLVAPHVCYAGVAEFIHDALPKRDVDVTLVDTSDTDAVAEAVREETRLVYVETPSNPTLQVTDIEAVAGIARGAGAALAVDSTIATPVATRPLALGADFVVHSMTKYLNGHGDATGGIVVGAREAMGRLRADAAVHLGATLSPFNAWLILRGLRSLWLRVRAHSAGAGRVAEHLEAHPAVAAVHYPGLASHPAHELARRQMAAFSGLLSFRLRDGGEEWARTLSSSLDLIAYAVSLGEQRSLIFHIPTADILRSSFHLEGSLVDRYRALAGDGLFRISVGVEDPGDLCADLDRALEVAPTS